MTVDRHIDDYELLEDTLLSPDLKPSVFEDQFSDRCLRQFFVPPVELVCGDVFFGTDLLDASRFQ